MKFTKQYTDWDKLPIVLDVEMACILLRCCDVTVRNRIKDGSIRGAKNGKDWCIDRDSVREFVSGKSKQSPS